MLTLTLPAELHDALASMAKAKGWSVESLAIDAIADGLDNAIRYRALLERMESVDQALLDIATLVGDASAAADMVAGGGGPDLASLCRYKPPGR